MALGLDQTVQVHQFAWLANRVASEVGVSGKGDNRLVTWNGAPVQAIAGSGMVRVNEPSVDHDRVIFAEVAAPTRSARVTLTLMQTPCVMDWPTGFLATRYQPRKLCSKHGAHARITTTSNPEALLTSRVRVRSSTGPARFRWSKITSHPGTLGPPAFSFAR